MSTPRDEVATFLKQWANSPSSPHFAVLIEGAWGCGKTHFVKSLIEDDGFTERKVIYLSLFGVTDTASFQTQLFFATASKAGKTIHVGASVFAGVAKAAFRIDLDGDGQKDGTANLGFSGLEKWIEKASSVDNALIILDDLERCPMQASDLLGIINPFIEHGDARVLIVSNTEQIDDKKFEAVREKLVGKSFKLTADVENALSSFIKDVPNAETKERLNQFRSEIIEVYHRGDFNNLRQLKQFIWHLTALLEKFESQFLENEPLVSATIEQFWIMLTEITTDGSDVSIDDILRQNNHFSELSMLFNVDDENPAIKLLRKYDHQNHLTTVISGQQWTSIVESGVVNAKWLNHELASAPQVKDKSSWPSWKRLWHFYDWVFSDGDDFQSDVEEVVDNLKNCKYKNAGELLHEVGINLMLAKEAIITESVEDIINSSKRAVETFLEHHFSYDLYLQKKRSGLHSHDGLIFWGNATDNFKEIYLHFSNELDKQRDRWLSSKAGSKLLQQLAEDYLQFLGNLIYLNEVRTNKAYVDTPILHYIPPTDFVAKWLSIPRRNEINLVGSLRDRYKQQPQLLNDELTWWEKVRDELYARSCAETIVPRSVQIRWLAEHVENEIVVPGKSVTADANVENTTPTQASPDPE